MRCEYVNRVLFATFVMFTISAATLFAKSDQAPFPKGEITRIAIGSCAKQWQHQPIWDAVIDAQPDLFLFLGDAIYADTDGKTAWSVTEGQLKGEWNRLAGKVGGHLPDDDSGKTLLGDTQWRWLEQQLKLQAEVRLVASSIQIIPDQKGMDEWGNFPLERKKLFDLIDRTGAKGIILLSGNVHFAELSKTDAGDYPLFELTSSGMTHINKTYAAAPNTYRVKGPFTGTHFGVVEIDWGSKPAPLINLKIISADGDGEISHIISLGNISKD